jgi:ABC-type lipoprotein release transport system permease subunit
MVPEQDPPEAGQVLIGTGISRSRNVFPGDILSFRDARGAPALFLVKGLLSGDSELVSSDLILISPGDFRNFFDLSPRFATDLALEVADRKALNFIAAQITEQLPDTRPLTRAEILGAYSSLFQLRGGRLAAILTGPLLAFFLLAWGKASGLSAEGKKEIGILKAVGWETADVLLMKFWEGTVLALSSFLIGFALAYFHVFCASAGLFEQALKGWAILYPKFRLVPHVDPYQVITIFLLTVVPYVAATILASWRAATSDPDTAMRS